MRILHIFTMCLLNSQAVRVEATGSCGPPNERAAASEDGARVDPAQVDATARLPPKLPLSHPTRSLISSPWRYTIFFFTQIQEIVLKETYEQENTTFALQLRLHKVKTNEDWHGRHRDSSTQHEHRQVATSFSRERGGSGCQTRECCG